jgi:cupin 2 domain-containing protein
MSLLRNLLRIPGNIAPGTEEHVEDLLSGSGPLRAQRIISHGHVTPEGEWYDQEEDEWVAVLEGSAKIAFPDGREVSLHAGDSLLLPRRVQHRVSWSSSPCVWLALFARELADLGET